MPSAALDFIRDNLEDSTPVSLTPRVRKKFPAVSAAQVHKAWTTMSETMWKRAFEPLESARKLLTEFQDDVEVLHLEAAEGVVQLAWVMKRIAKPLKSVVEIAMDATCKQFCGVGGRCDTDLVAVNTNSSHLELYTIMGECDNAGYPLSYCLLSTATSTELGKRTRALTNWAIALRDGYGIKPSYVHTDKDMAEVGMREHAWPDAKHSFCWWHMEKFVKDRFESHRLATTPYNPLIAHSIFAFIEPSYKPVGRSDPKDYEGGVIALPHDQQTLAIPANPDGLRIKLPPLVTEAATKSVESSDAATCIESDARAPIIQIKRVRLLLPNLPVPESNAFETSTESEMLEPEESDNPNIATTQSERNFCPIDHRRPIIDMIKSHYCAHPLIPGDCAPNPRAIYYWAVRQIFEYCYTNEVPPRVWVYLWGNLYRPARWRLWARSVSPQIPVLKATMICEAQ